LNLQFVPEPEAKAKLTVKIIKGEVNLDQLFFVSSFIHPGFGKLPGETYSKAQQTILLRIAFAITSCLKKSK